MAIHMFDNFECVPHDSSLTCICDLVDGMLFPLGDLTIFSTGDAVVMNGTDEATKFFTVSKEAFEYIIGNVCEHPVFIRRHTAKL